jgi:hypothetical protein
VKEKKPIIALILIGAAIAILIARSAEEEPSIRGHSLRYWVDSFGGFHPEQKNVADVEALSTIGTNAVPLLVHWVRCDLHPSRSRRAVTAILKHVPGMLIPKSVADWADGNAFCEERCYRALSAAAVFSVLGPKAEASIPALRTILINPSNGPGCLAAENALLHLGTNGFAAVMDVAATNAPMRGIILQNSFVRDRIEPVYTKVIPGPPGATEVLWQPTVNPDSRVNSARAAPVLLLCLEDTSPNVQGRAARYLSIGDPDAVLPAVTNFLMTSHPARIRRLATETLSTFGQKASNSVPFFVARLRDSDPDIRAEATNALMSISPERLPTHSTQLN